VRRKRAHSHLLWPAIAVIARYPDAGRTEGNGDWMASPEFAGDFAGEIAWSYSGAARTVI
jgi:hypothetical protein